MTFRETLNRHLQAILTRDLDTLMETVAPDEITLITPDGRVVRSPSVFAKMHADWFASGPWSLDASLLTMVESPNMGSATLLLDYREGSDEDQSTSRRSLLTLIFVLRAGVWVMVHDQNTRIREPVGGESPE